MKIYDFICLQCNYEEELLVKNDEKPKCPNCDTELKQKLSSPGMVKTNFADKTGFKSRRK